MGAASAFTMNGYSVVGSVGASHPEELGIERLRTGDDASDIRVLGLVGRGAVQLVLLAQFSLLRFLLLALEAFAFPYTLSCR